MNSLNILTSAKQTDISSVKKQPSKTSISHSSASSDLICLTYQFLEDNYIVFLFKSSFDNNQIQLLSLPDSVFLILRSQLCLPTSAFLCLPVRSAFQLYTLPAEMNEIKEELVHAWMAGCLRLNHFYIHLITPATRSF